MIQVFEGTGTKPLLIRSLSGTEPHESYGSWEGFLAQGRCEIKDQVDGVIFYNHVNCNYILFPNSIIVENYGLAGENVMAQVRKFGWRVIFDGLKEARD